MRTRIYATLALLLALVGISKAQTAGQYSMQRKNDGAGFTTTWHTVGNDYLFATNGSGVFTPILKSTFEPALTIGTGISRSGATISVNMGALTPPWSGITSKPTTLSGYGITDAIATGGEAGTVASIGNLTGVVTSVNRATSIADAALSIAKTSGLQTALDGKQPLDSDLTSIAALTTTSFGRSVLTTADAAALRTLQGLGTAATVDTGTLAGNVPVLGMGGTLSISTGSASTGLQGLSDTGYGVVGFSDTGHGGYFHSGNAIGLIAASMDFAGAQITSTNEAGAYISSDASYGASFSSNTGSGALASSQSGTAIELYSGGGDILKASNAATADVFVIDSSGSITSGTIPSSGISDASEFSNSGIVVRRGSAGEAEFGSDTSATFGITTVSGTGDAIQALAGAGRGLAAFTTSGVAVYGKSTSGPLLRLQNNSGGGTTVFEVANNGAITAPSLTGNAGSATTLQTGRTLAITGDLTWTSPSFNGAGNVTAAGTLAASGVTAGSYGSATASPAFTVDAKGRVTAAASTTITPAVSSITGMGTGVSTLLGGNSTGTGGPVGSSSPTITTPTIASIAGGTAANDDLTLQGTTNATRTTSHVLIQPNGGLTQVGAGTPVTDAALPLQLSTGTAGTETNIGINKNGAYGFLLGYKNGTGTNFANYLGGYMRNVTTDPFSIIVNNTNISTAWTADGSVGLGGTVTHTGTLAGAHLIVSGTTGNISIGKTITAGGSTGTQTINKPSGSINFAAGASSVVVTNSLVTTASVIMLTMASNDSTAAGLRVVAGSGSFTIHCATPPAAEMRVNFLLTN